MKNYFNTRKQVMKLPSHVNSDKGTKFDNNSSSNIYIFMNVTFYSSTD